MEFASLVATTVARRRRVRLVVSPVVVDDDRGTASDYLSRTASGIILAGIGDRAGVGCRIVGR